MLLELQAMSMAALSFEVGVGFRFNDPRLSLMFENLAEIYWHRRKSDKAEPLCKQILEIVEICSARIMTMSAWPQTI